MTLTPQDLYKTQKKEIYEMLDGKNMLKLFQYEQ